MTRHVLMLLLTLVAVLGACSEPPAEPYEAAPGPEAAFDAARAARAAGDYASLYDLLAPETQKEFLGTVLVHCSFATLGPDAEQNARNEAALDAIFAKHGVTGIEESPLNALAKAADTLEDPGALAADLAAFAQEHRGTTGILELVEVRGVQVTGDRAVGAAVLRDAKGDKPPRDVEFVRDGDDWRLRLILQ